jgi:hypothetical protein
MSIQTKWFFSIVFFIWSLFFINWDELHQNVLMYLRTPPIITDLGSLPAFIYSLFGGR